MDSVEEFIDWHGTLQDEVEERLNGSSVERVKYMEIETVDAKTILWVLSTGY